MHIIHLPNNVSDHLPIVAYLTKDEIHYNIFERRNRNHRFLFEEMWVKEEGFKEIVEKAWSIGVPIFSADDL